MSWDGRNRRRFPRVAFPCLIKIRNAQGKDDAMSFEERFTKLLELRSDLADVEDAGIELILGRSRANIPRVSHLLRAHGCHMSLQLLAKFDDSTAAFISRVLGGDLQEQALEKSAFGGALGSRRRPCLRHQLARPPSLRFGLVWRTYCDWPVKPGSICRAPY